MTNFDLTENTQHRIGNTEVQNDINQWGQAILRSKTTLIKPYSKYTQEGLRPRTPNDPYTILTKEQVSSIDRSASSLFFDQPRISNSTGVFRRFRQRQTDSLPMSHLRTGGTVGGGTQFTYITPQAYTSKLPDKYNGCSADSYPKWYPNRAGERTLAHSHEGIPVERYVSIDMFRRPPTSRSGQIIFDHGRPNDGYYLPRNGYDTTWFHSDIELNRRHILDSIQPKTLAEYQQEKANRQDQYRKAKGKWPHLSEYGEQFVLGTTIERTQKIDLERAKQHIGQNPTRFTSLHNQLAASAVVQGRTLINDPPLIVKCLTQRVESIVTVLKRISKFDFNDNGMEHALKDINNTLEQCLNLIEKQLTTTSPLEQYRDYTKQFIQLNEQLSQNSITLNLALNINLIFNPRPDPSDQPKFSNEQRNHFLHVSKTDLQFEELIGQGGFADVYRGIWISRDHPIAIKVFHFTDITSKIKQNILNEISIMYQIRYDHLLGILGACVEPNYYAIIIEYMPLGSLFDILQRKEQIFSWSDRWSIALQMTKGINYLHKMSIIHQDIKSLNILMDKTIHGYLVKVSDFGLAKMEEEIQRETKQMKRKKTIIGTSRWTAPELFNSNPPSMTSDIYSLGIIFWELATGSIPYEGWNDEDIIRNIMKGFRQDIPLNVPERFELIISNAWNQQADKRPSCQQLIEDIKEGSKSTSNTQKIRHYISEPDDTINKRQNSTSSPITNTEYAANQLNDNSQFVTARTIVNDELTLENLIDEYKLHEDIQLSERQLTDQDMNIVVDLAIIAKQCRALFLYSNNITCQGALILCDSLHGNTTLEELYIFDNHLSDIGVRYLVEPLKFTNSTLKYLHLANNSITDHGVEYLADMLQTNTTLTHLWLDNNEISNRGIQLLTNVLIRDNRSLSALYLRGNTLINDLCVSDLIDMFKNNNSLESISISNCDLSESGKMRLKRAISSQRGLKLNI